MNHHESMYSQIDADRPRSVLMSPYWSWNSTVPTTHTSFTYDDGTTLLLEIPDDIYSAVSLEPLDGENEPIIMVTNEQREMVRQLIQFYSVGVTSWVIAPLLDESVGASQ